MSDAGVVPVLISLLALAVSIASLLDSRRGAKAQERLQERLLSLELARERDRLAEAKAARLQARVELRDRTHQLVIHNVGPVVARTVRVVINNELFRDSSLVPHGQELPSTLGPGAEYRLLLGVAMGFPPSFRVRLEWEDESGQPGRWESHLSIYG